MCAVSNMAVFCSSLISCFNCMLLRYCLSDLEMVPVAPVITGITVFYIQNEFCFYCKVFMFTIFSASLLIKVLSSETSLFIGNYHY